MPRKNKRSDYTPPEDMTPAAFIPRSPLGGPSTPAERAQAAREAAERQRLARMNNGIDWSVCLVPGCGEPIITWGGFRFSRPEDRDPTRNLPICVEHALTQWRVIERTKGRPEVIEADTAFQARETERKQALHNAEKEAFLKRVDGDIYFVRLNNLVKVGWSRDLRSRLKDYGASAEVLCHFPATRDDETLLHRQLKPALAKGREWYHDGDVIALFLTKALEKYGPPTAAAYWTEPKPIVGKRNY